MKLVIQKQNLRSQAREAIVELVLSGKVKPGERLNETQLAQEVGISQTPIREALISLESESFLTFSPGSGFRVCELSVRQVEEIYPMMALLECFALELIDEFPKQFLTELKTINKRFLEAKTPISASKADKLFHHTLVKRCSNELLLLQIDSVRRAAYRYELAFMRSQQSFKRSVNEHNKIIRALSKGDVADAQKWLKANCLVTMGPLKEWVESINN